MARFIQARNYTKGRIRTLRVIVWHDMEAPEGPSTAENVAAYFAGSGAPQASAHVCADPNSVVECVKPGDTAWHAPGANADGYGIELAGYARQSHAQWLDATSKATITNAAKWVAPIMRAHGIPAVWLTDAQLRDGRTRGMTTHAQVTRVFRRSDHTDPGPNFPADFVLEQVRAALHPAAPKPAPAPAPKPAPAPAPKPAPAPAPAPKPAPAPRPSAKPRTVTVKSGDTLWKIAGALGVTVAALLGANHITAGTAIKPGQVITAPATVTVTPKPTATAPIVVKPKPTAPAAKPKPKPVVRLSQLKSGARNGSVLTVQKALAKAVGLKYTTARGLFGPATKAALAKYRAKVFAMSTAGAVRDLGKKYGFVVKP